MRIPNSPVETPSERPEQARTGGPLGVQSTIQRTLRTAHSATRAVGLAARLTRDLPRFLDSPLSAEQAAGLVAGRLARRPDSFLWLAEHAIYRHSRSPYRWLLHQVGCEPGDLRALVEREGVEGALRLLAQRGVYLTFRESKGGHEIVRGSQHLLPREEDFDNPTVSPHFDIRTGGTRSSGTRVPVSLNFLSEVACNHSVGLEAHGLGEALHVLWHTAPLRDLLLHARRGTEIFAWYHQIQPLPPLVRVGGAYLRVLGKALGVRFPPPEWADLKEPDPLVALLGRLAAQGRRVCVTTLGSSAVRAATIARERGLSLRGVTFSLRGEPYTDAKVRAIEASGATAIDSYGFVESGGLVALSCATAGVVDDVHLFSDRLAVIHDQDVREANAPVLFTSLLPNSPRILLNASNGDAATIEERDCGCALGQLGLRTHLSEIGSHEKLTGEGTSFVRTRLTHVIEQVLPSRFGGSSGDYQVIEQETPTGILRLVLLISQRVGAIDAESVRSALLAELRRGSLLEKNMAQIWERAETIQVERRDPIATNLGKVLPFHLARGKRR